MARSSPTPLFSWSATRLTSWPRRGERIVAKTATSTKAKAATALQLSTGWH
jgi:hypothetical protein